MRVLRRSAAFPSGEVNPLSAWRDQGDGCGLVAGEIQRRAIDGQRGALEIEPTFVTFGFRCDHQCLQHLPPAIMDIDQPAQLRRIIR